MFNSWELFAVFYLYFRSEWASNFVDSYVDRSTNISQNIIYEARLIFIENILTSSIQIMLDAGNWQEMLQ